MARHIVDQPRHRAGQSLSQFLRLERLRREAGPRTHSVRRAPRPMNNAVRLRRFLQVARTIS